MDSALAGLVRDPGVQCIHCIDIKLPAETTFTCAYNVSGGSCAAKNLWLLVWWEMSNMTVVLEIIYKYVIYIKNKITQNEYSIQISHTSAEADPLS